jgi:hypothetical protein
MGEATMDVQPEVVESKEVVELTTEEMGEVGGGFGIVPDPHVANDGVTRDPHVVNG